MRLKPRRLLQLPCDCALLIFPASSQAEALFSHHDGRCAAADARAVPRAAGAASSWRVMDAAALAPTRDKIVTQACSAPLLSQHDIAQNKNVSPQTGPLRISYHVHLSPFSRGSKRSLSSYRCKLRITCYPLFLHLHTANQPISAEPFLFPRVKNQRATRFRFKWGKREGMGREAPHARKKLC